jgi:hypothetical protein
MRFLMVMGSDFQAVAGLDAGVLEPAGAAFTPATSFTKIINVMTSPRKASTESTRPVVASGVGEITGLFAAGESMRATQVSVGSSPAIKRISADTERRPSLVCRANGPCRWRVRAQRWRTWRGDRATYTERRE